MVCVRLVPFRPDLLTYLLQPCFFFLRMVLSTFFDHRSQVPVKLSPDAPGSLLGSDAVAWEASPRIGATVAAVTAGRLRT